MKRALRVYGNRLGNCAYDKAFLRDVKNGPARPAPVAQTMQPVPQMQPPPVPTVPLDASAKPPPNYTPTWTSAKTVMSPPTGPVLPSHIKDSDALLLHSDDFDALITEANLYDLEASTSLDTVMMALDARPQ